MLNGTCSPASTVNSEIVERFSPRSGTGVRRVTASGPAMAEMPQSFRRTHGTIDP